MKLFGDLRKLLLTFIWVAVISNFLAVWPLELLASFTLYVLVIGVILAVAFWWKRWWRAGFVWAVLGLMILAITPLNLLAANKTIEPLSAKPVVLYTHNMLFSSRNQKEVAEQILQNKADIVAVQEALPEEIDHLRKETGFRDYFVSDCQCSVNNDEIALISRYPIKSAKSIQVDSRGGRMIDAEVTINQRDTRVIVVHVPTPVVPQNYRTRGSGFNKITSLLKSEQRPIIVMGDFNTSLWSPVLHRFQGDNPRLKNVAFEQSQSNSWCSHLVPLICLRIDHTFVSRDIRLISSKIGQPAGSDHRPVITKIEF